MKNGEGPVVCESVDRGFDRDISGDVVDSARAVEFLAVSGDEGDADTITASSVTLAPSPSSSSRRRRFFFRSDCDGSAARPFAVGSFSVCSLCFLFLLFLCLSGLLSGCAGVLAWSESCDIVTVHTLARSKNLKICRTEPRASMSRAERRNACPKAFVGGDELRQTCDEKTLQRHDIIASTSITCRSSHLRKMKTP